MTASADRPRRVRAVPRAGRPATEEDWLRVKYDGALPPGHPSTWPYVSDDEFPGRALVIEEGSGR